MTEFDTGATKPTGALSAVADAPTAVDKQTAEEGGTTIATMPGVYYYGDGMRYVDGLVEALVSALNGKFEVAGDQAESADCILAPLGEEGDPHALRDFIAGAARAAEHHLEQAGVPIRW